MGAIIVIEGIEGSGKETQSKLLVNYLEKHNYKVVEFSFPMYDSPTGRIFDECLLDKNSPSWFPEGYNNLDPEVVCLYTAADRKYNSKKIKEYLDKDYIVVLNRYTSSNMAHQASKYNNADDRFYMYQWIDKLEYWLLKLPKPDCTILLKMPYNYIKQVTFNLDNEDNEPNKVFKAYLELSELYNWDVIECVKDNNIKDITRIHQEIIEILKNKGLIV